MCIFITSNISFPLPPIGTENRQRAQSMIRVVVEDIVHIMEHGIDTGWELLDGTPIRSHMFPVAYGSGVL